MTQEEVIDLVKNNRPRHFKKTGTFSYVVCREEQQVATVIIDKQETSNVARQGDYIVTGTRGERFVVRPEVFEKRYRIISPGIAEAIGECWGNVYRGAAFDFESPWEAGSTIHCEPGDYLVSPDAHFREAYRVEKEIFEETYTLVSG